MQPLHPKFAEHIVGHGEVEKQLLTMIAAKRLPHALLFTGPRGIGKATLAYRLARFLLAPSDSNAGLFGDPLLPESLHLPALHPTFRRLVADAHPDFLVLEADDIKVEEARSVGTFLSLTPAESDRRVVIIDSADAMNRNAANALLKTLEEPPPRTVLLLVSHNPGALLPTIRSRCRAMRVPPLGSSEFAQVLVSIAPEVSSADAPLWALLSGGSPGVALGLMHAHADALYRELLELISAADTLANHAFADKFARKDSRHDWQVFTRLFTWLLARIASGGTGPEVYGGEQDALNHLRSRKPVDFWLELWERGSMLLGDTTHLHLDRKQAILTLLKAAGE